jgi:hypothetical protein
MLQNALRLCQSVGILTKLFIYLFIYWLTILDIKFCFKKGKEEEEEKKSQKNGLKSTIS